MQIEFTGAETPAEIARTAVEWFAEEPTPSSVTIFYDGSIPKLKYEFQGGAADVVCVYRLDKMLETLYSAAENVFNENLSVGFVAEENRAILVAYIAFGGMSAMLSHLVVLISQVFLDTLEGTHLLMAGITLHSLVAQHSDQAAFVRTANKEVQQWIDTFIGKLAKEKLDYFAGYMNTHRLFHIPTGVGRPPGTTKSEEQKAREAAQTADEVEKAVRTLYETTGKRPTRTEIAQFLKPGINPKTGTDSRLSVFSKKIRKQGINFDEIVNRVCGLPEN